MRAAAKHVRLFRADPDARRASFALSSLSSRRAKEVHVSRKARGAWVLVFVGVAVLLPAAAQPSHGPSVVKYKMVEWDIIPQNAFKSHGPLGKVTFVVQNAGKLKHEFVVIRTKTAAGELAKTGATRVPEKGDVGEIENIPAGQTRTIALKLTQGHYALICNFKSHWNNGQFVDYYIH
jgi:uncharacterized cupredoxin-like copper-binding protein